MPPLKEVSSSRGPADYLRLALQAGSPRERARFARRGLDAAPSDVDPDTQVLLLRQLYLAHLDSHRYRDAAEVAVEMSEIGPLKDVAHCDASRAFYGAGEIEAAIAHQRLAARWAPASRRSFQYWSLATLLH